MAASKVEVPVRSVRVLQAQLAKWSKDGGDPNMLAVVNDTNIGIWHVMVAGLPPPVDGEYFFELRAPADFPAKPPLFWALTPNGVYGKSAGPASAHDKGICISIGAYHADDSSTKDGAQGWRPALGMAGFAREACINGLLSPDLLGSGLGINPEAVRERECAHLAHTSAAWNRRNLPRLTEAADRIVAEQPDLAFAATLRRCRLGAKGIANAKALAAPDVLAVFPHLAPHLTLAAKLPAPIAAKCGAVLTAAAAERGANERAARDAYLAAFLAAALVAAGLAEAGALTAALATLAPALGAVAGRAEREVSGAVAQLARAGEGHASRAEYTAASVMDIVARVDALVAAPVEGKVGAAARFIEGAQAAATSVALLPPAFAEVDEVDALLAEM
jgi:ubiquitin-protein ligase